MTGKVLITGGAGFIGAYMAQALISRDFEVQIADNFSRGQKDAFLMRLCEADNVYLSTVDLLYPEALSHLPEDFSYIMHLAALLGVENVLERPYDTLRNNVLMLERVLELAQRQRKLERFIFASTSEVYAGSLKYMGLPWPTPEDTPIALPDLGEPRTSYMLSKIYGEAMVRHAGVPFTIIRPHNIYGPRMGNAHVIPQLLERAYKTQDGGELEVFSVDHRRTFCFIEDAVEMLLRVMDNTACEGQTLNLGRERPEITMGEVAEVVIAAVGKHLSVVPRPATPGSPPRRCPDMSRMLALTGCRAQVDLEVGIQRTYAWYRDNIFGES